jgi:streptogramin lyase
LFEDSHGRLWAGAYGSGVNLSDPAKSRFSLVEIRNPDTINSSLWLLYDFCEDASGRFWLSTQDGLIILSGEGPEFDRVDPDSLIPSWSDCRQAEIIRSLHADIYGRVWIGMDSGLFVFDEGAVKLYCPGEMEGLPANGINMIEEDRMGRIWLSCQGSGPRFYFIKSSELKFEPFGGIEFASKKSNLTFGFDLDNRIWISEFGHQFYGYDFRDSTLFLESSVNSSAPYERFGRTPFIDHTGNVWLPCEGYLIYPYPKGFENYLHPFTFFQSSSAIYGDGDDLWLAYRERGVVKLNTITGETRHFASTNPDAWIPEDHVVDFLRTRAGHLILVGFNRVAVLDEQDRVIRNYSLPGTNRAIYEDSAGRLWIGGFGGLIEFSAETGILDTIRLPRNIGDTRNFIQSILEDRNGHIWFASDINGLARLSPTTGELIQLLPVRGDTTTLPSSSVEEIILDREGMIWAATDVALVRIDPVTLKITSFNHHSGIKSDYINALVCDASGMIWAATNDGVSSFDPVTLQVVNYGADDGLLNKGYYSRCSFIGDDGTIYFGGPNGMDYFKPGSLRDNPTPPVMYLDGVVVDNMHKVRSADIANSQQLALTHKNDLIEISFSGLYYSAPQSVQYYYKMEGLNDDWIDIGAKHSATFTDLKPGEYLFRAKAISPDGVWSRDDLVIPIVIAPPFFETMWFRLLAVCVLGALLFGIIRYREQGIRIRQKREAEVSRKITELEKRALQAQMNPHFIYNCMNSIQQFMVVHDFEGAMKYLTRFSRILRAVLNMSAQSRVSLTDEIKLIEDYLELENMRFPNKFSYRIDVDPKLNVHTVEIPPFFIQPQVENAIRHGLLRKEGGGELVLRIAQEGTYLKVAVEDNGIGRRASMAVRIDETHRESKGLSIVEERLSHLHQANGIHPLTITDLYDTANNPAGTRVEVYLPLDH